MNAPELRANWSKRDNDYLVHYPASSDGHLMHQWISGHIPWTMFKEQLEIRGYDITTFRVSIRRKRR